MGHTKVRCKKPLVEEDGHDNAYDNGAGGDQNSNNIDSSAAYGGQAETPAAGGGASNWASGEGAVESGGADTWASGGGGGGW